MSPNARTLRLSVPLPENSSEEDTIAAVVISSPRSGRRRSSAKHGARRLAAQAAAGGGAAVHKHGSPSINSLRPPSSTPAAMSARGSKDGGSVPDPHNFLLGGGAGRALDGERARAKAAAAHRAAADLRGSNAALAAELARVRAEGEREGGALRAELASLAGRFKAEQVGGAWAGGVTLGRACSDALLAFLEQGRPVMVTTCLHPSNHMPPPHTHVRAQERLAALRERLAAECRGRAELEAAHQERVRELHKRLQAEHLLRWVAASGRAGVDMKFTVPAAWLPAARRGMQVEAGRQALTPHDAIHPTYPNTA